MKINYVSDKFWRDGVATGFELMNMKFEVLISIRSKQKCLTLA